MARSANSVALLVTLHAMVIIAYLTDCHTEGRLQYRSSRYGADLYRNYYRDDDDVMDFENGENDVDDDDDYEDEDEDDVRPRFLPTERNVTASPGEDVLMRCYISNLMDRMVMWRRLGIIHPLTIGSVPFVSDSRVSVVQREHPDDDYSEWNLRLRNVAVSDEGTYKCQVNTKDDQKNFNVVYLHVSIIQVTGTEYVERGGDIELLCNATGRPNPPHNVEWYKDNRMIESDGDDGVFITKKIETRLLVSLLVIKRSKASDTGEYHCRSSDQDVGKISVKVQNGTSAAKITGGNTSTKAVCLRSIWFAWLLTAVVMMR